MEDGYQDDIDQMSLFDVDGFYGDDEGSTAELSAMEANIYRKEGLLRLMKGYGNPLKEIKDLSDELDLLYKEYEEMLDD